MKKTENNSVHFTALQTKYYQLLIVVLSGLLVLGQLQRIQLANGLALYLHDGIAGLLLMLFVRDFGRTWWQKYRHILFSWRWEWFLVMWSIASLMIAAVQGDFSVSAWLYTGRIGFYIAVIGALLFLAHHNQVLHRTLVWSVLGVVMGIMWFGILQYLLLPDTRSLHLLGWDDHYYRVISTMLDPGFTGLLLVFGFWFAQSEIWLKVMKLPFLKHLFSLLILITLLLTYSRASYLAFITGVLAILCVEGLRKAPYQRLIALVVWTVLFVGAIPFLPRPGGEGVKLERTASVEARIISLDQGISTLKGTQWITGRGLFTPNPRPANVPADLPYHGMVIENWVLFFLNGTGIVGLTLALIVFVRWLYSTSQQSSWLHATLISLAIHGVFNASVVYPFVLLIGGMLVVTYLTSTTQQR